MDIQLVESSFVIVVVEYTLAYLINDMLNHCVFDVAPTLRIIQRNKWQLRERKRFNG